MQPAKAKPADKSELSPFFSLGNAVLRECAYLVNPVLWKYLWASAGNKKRGRVLGSYWRENFLHQAILQPDPRAWQLCCQLPLVYCNLCPCSTKLLWDSETQLPSAEKLRLWLPQQPKILGETFPGLSLYSLLPTSAAHFCLAQPTDKTDVGIYPGSPSLYRSYS